MTFVKLQKNKAYFKRFQVKFRRRREGKTDYRARKRLVAQEKNKYATARHRFVVRMTNRFVICQVVRSKIDHDEVVCSAYSSELPRYGLAVGLKNYAAAYATGLLCARRALQKLGLDKLYTGNTEVTGEVVTCEDDAGRTLWVSKFAEEAEKRPLRAFLDVGIATTTTGNNVFGALKGAADGGLDIPHSEKRFPGYDAEAKEFSAEMHRDRIFGQHVAEYMGSLKEEDPERYARQFSKYIAKGVEGDALEELYASVHAKIRADPTPAPKSGYKPDKSFKNPTKLTGAERKARVAAKKEEAAAKLAARMEAMADEDDE